MDVFIYQHRKIPTNFTRDGTEHQILFIDITHLSYPFAGGATLTKVLCSIYGGIAHELNDFGKQYMRR